MPAIITREVLKRRLDAGEDVVVVDVLSPESYRAHHLPGAINLPVSVIASDAVRDLPRDKVVVVYCASFACQASPTAARKLEVLGFTQVLDFGGGLQDWVDAGYPLERSAE